MKREEGNQNGQKVQSPQDINKAIRDLLVGSRKVRLSGLSGQDNIAVGLTGDVQIDIKGDAGKYLGAFNSGPQLVLNGSSGDQTADTMTAGTMIVQGSSGKNSGICMVDGTLVIKGSTGPGTGRYMTGGKVLIDGDVKGDAAEGMEGGTLIVNGSIQGEVGRYSSGGTIFISGSVSKKGANSMEVPLSESEIALLSKDLDRFSVNAPPRTFRKIVAKTVPSRGGP